ncbi:hypothetical protein [Stenotrophomonas sp. HMWF023]|uniref:hypothetical protein n=1 Tax=Stenotrophomonas sp. HMWF023 TaxID=2056859 RepID=UPI000D3C308B|nr:hypothetical protein [Stenotrophomonas sp. HMWF023]PTS74831.1 hypothetical protein DBR20_12745 [Stenotrophomonas sp. HMWF023]
MAAPTIQSVYLNGATLRVTWSGVSDASITAYVVTVYFGTQTPFITASFTPTGTPTQTGSLNLPGGALDTNTSYFVQVSTMWGNTPGQGQTSQFVPLITRVPVLQAAYFDGTDMLVEWEPSDQASQGYFLQVYGSAGSPFTATVPDASTWWTKIPGVDLATGQQWNLQVAATGTVSSDDGDALYAARSAVPLLASPQPTLAGAVASYESDALGGIIRAGWTALAASTGVTHYRVQAYDPEGNPDRYVDVPGAASTSGVLYLEDRFAPGSTLRILALSDAGVGVATPASPVVVSPPQLTSAAFAPGNATIAVAWSTATDPAVTGFTVEVYDAANPSTSYPQTFAGAGARQATYSALPAAGLDPTKAWNIRVLATGTQGTAPALGAPWRLPVAPATVTAAICEGNALDVAWTLAAGAPVPAAYVLSLSSADSVVASVQVAGGQAAQGRVLVADPGKSCTASVSPVGPEGAVGPSSAATTVLVAQVAGLTAVTDAVSQRCTLSWSAVTNATSYSIDSGNGAPITQAGTTYTFDSALPGGADLAVAVTPLIVSAGSRIAGPTPAPHRLPTQRATVVSAQFDAATMQVTVNWAALAGATGYRIAIMADAGGTCTEVSHASAPAGATTGTVAFPADFELVGTTTYRAVVQGLWNGDSGLQANHPPIFSAGFYLSADAATTAPPFVYPATVITTATTVTTTTTAGFPMVGEEVTLYLPDIGAGTPLTTPLPQKGAFTLGANTDPARNSAAYPYTLTISNTSGTNNPWAFAPAQTVRTGLAGDVAAFLKEVESAGAVPWGIVQLQQVLGRAFPQTFAEQLYYAFGLAFPQAGVPQGYVDLRPGMVLRVVPNPYQSVPGQTQASWLSGYVGAASIDYDIGSVISANGAWSAGFDAFLGQLVGNGALSVTPPVARPTDGLEQGVAEAADLYFPTFAQSFYRLFVPQALLSPSGPGSVVATDNFVLAAAPSYAGISSATSAPSASANVAYFRGRAVLKACLRVTFDGVERVVPVGTTLGNLLEQYGRLGAATPAPLTGVRLDRGLGGAVLDPLAATPALSAPVMLDWQAKSAAVYAPGWGFSALPLLPGDRITLC